MLMKSVAPSAIVCGGVVEMGLRKIVVVEAGVTVTASVPALAE
jgi:hypothetical protein